MRHTGGAARRAAGPVLAASLIRHWRCRLWRKLLDRSETVVLWRSLRVRWTEGESPRQACSPLLRQARAAALRQLHQERL